MFFWFVAFVHLHEINFRVEHFPIWLFSLDFIQGYFPKVAIEWHELERLAGSMPKYHFIHGAFRILC